MASRPSQKKLSPVRSVSNRFDSPIVGTLTGFDDDGLPLVDFPGNPATAITARSTMDAPAPVQSGQSDWIGARVVLIFENGDPTLPIITGFVHKQLRPAAREGAVRVDASQAKDVLIDGQRLVLEANHEIILRCGRSTLVLRKDGKIEIKGDHLISRGKSTNRIKGGIINLN